ncbi:ribose transport system permease protein [Thermanaeromonas toyohensis ToBE]|uniref:Ribose transport system permease protein n=1 Tax=Thermanaeromonas toyohensis ToBE TaxID=698762 RepID=A0A1W1VPB2_9FIRM|nr:ABC transporter permease [Thermanaeromonas toyohensis]SMB95199.1 ribose transport system permease protein [Thermanaeromonas toyohensis ToBE]
MPSVLRKYGTLIGFLVLCVIFSFLSPVFLTVDNLVMVLLQGSMLTIIALGTTVVMAAGGFDMSFGSVCGLIGVALAGMLVKGVPIPLAILISLAMGAAFGCVNGILVAVFGIADFIATLSTMSIARGLNYYYTRGEPIFMGIPPEFKIIGQGKIGIIGYPVLIMLAVLVILYVFMNHTVTGRQIYAVGGNKTAARLSGINVRWIRIFSFIIGGLAAALTAVIVTSRLGSGQPTAGEGFLLDGLAAVFLGMTMFKEGEPHISGTFIGALIMGVLVNGLNLLGVQYFFQDILKGLIILAAVGLTATGKPKD